MNGVQAAIFSGSAMILLVLALRLFLKKSICQTTFICTQNGRNCLISPI